MKCLIIRDIFTFLKLAVASDAPVLLYVVQNGNPHGMDGGKVGVFENSLLWHTLGNDCVDNLVYTTRFIWMNDKQSIGGGEITYELLTVRESPFQVSFIPVWIVWQW